MPRSESIIHTEYCPNCDHRLEIHEYDSLYIIVDDDHAVTSCPNCLEGLEYENGALVCVS